MARFGVPAIFSIIIALIGVLFFIAAVAGLLFEEPTPVTDVGMWSVTIVFVLIGALGLWASLAEDKQRQGQ